MFEKCSQIYPVGACPPATASPVLRVSFTLAGSRLEVCSVMIINPYRMGRNYSYQLLGDGRQEANVINYSVVIEDEVQGVAFGCDMWACHKTTPTLALKYLVSST